MKRLLRALVACFVLLVGTSLALILLGVGLWFAEDLGLGDPLAGWVQIEVLEGYQVPWGATPRGQAPRTLLTLHQDGSARLLDLASRQDLLTLEDPRGPIRFATASSKTGSFYTSSYDRDSGLGYGRLWNPRGKSPQILAGPGIQAEGIQISPDGSRVATFTEGSGTDLWEASSGEWLGKIPNQAAEFSPDGHRLLTLAQDRVHLWKLDPLEREKEIQPARVHSSGLAEAHFSPDGKFALVWGHHQRLWVLDLETGRELWSHKSWKGEFSPDSRLVLTTTRGLVQLWSARLGREHRVQKGTDIGSACFEGNDAVLIQSYHGIQRWDLASDRLQPVLPEVKGRFPVVAQEASLLLTRTERQLHLWDPLQGTPRGTLDQGDRLDEAGFLGGGRAVYGWTHYGDRRTGEDRLRVWKLPEGKALWQERGQRKLRKLAIAGGRWLATLDPARVLDAANGATRSTLRRAVAALPAHFEADGKKLVSWPSPGEKSGTLWSTDGARQLQRADSGAIQIELPKDSAGRVEIHLKPGKNGQILEIQTRGEEKSRVSFECPGPISGVSLDPTGARVAFTAAGKLWIWNWTQEKDGPAFSRGLPDSPGWLGFDGPGESLLVSTEKGILIFRDHRTRLRRFVSLARSLLGV